MPPRVANNEVVPLQGIRTWAAGWQDGGMGPAGCALSLPQQRRVRSGFYFVCHSRCARYSYLLHTLWGADPPPPDYGLLTRCSGRVLGLLQYRLPSQMAGLHVHCPWAWVWVWVWAWASCLAVKTLQLQLFDGIYKAPPALVPVCLDIRLPPDCCNLVYLVWHEMGAPEPQSHRSSESQRGQKALNDSGAARKSNPMTGELGMLSCSLTASVSRM